jgi:UPF0716 family protein affecting phage T7 exclusion
LLVLLAGWLLLEYVLLELLAARIGWGLVLALLSLKGGLGLLVLAFMTVSAARTVRASKDLGRFAAIGFPLASGILIALPGLIPMLVGIALFSPTLRGRVTSWRHNRASRQSDPRMLELQTSEWTEIGPKKTRRKHKSGKAPLERQPPSV